MKGSFKVYPYLMELEDAIKERENFAFLVVSTTGIDNSSCDAHTPTRVCLKEYEFDSVVGAYKEALVFDELVKCSDEGLANAVANSEKYDVFKNGGIDVTKYISGEGVLSVDEFKDKFNFFMDSLIEGDSEPVFIANGTNFCISYMDKIGCADKLIDLKEAEKIIDQTVITKEYIDKMSIPSKTATLDVLNHYVQNKDVSSPASKIVGTDKRADAMANFVIHYGRENKWLFNDVLVHYNKINQETYENFVQKGKDRYLESDFEGKFATLLGKNIISADVVDRDYPCDLNNLYDILEGKTDKKGIIVMQSATTGFTAGNFPIQLTAMVYELNDSKDLDGVCIMSMDINADKKSISKALQNKESGNFDAFAYTGINSADYIKGISSSDGNVLSADEAVDMINRFFKQFPTSDYAILSNGKSKNNDLSFTQDSLTKIGNMSVCNAPYIDFTQVIKEYTYEHMKGNMPNEVIDLDRIDGSNFKFSLECIAENNDIEVVNKHTKDKCWAMATIVNAIYQEARERVQDIDKTNDKVASDIADEKPIEAEVQNNIVPDHEIQSDSVSLDEFVSGIESGSVLNEAPEAPSTDNEYFEIPTQAELLSEIEVQAMMNGQEYGTRSLNDKERELYSNRHNDSIPVVVTDGNVQQIGEAPIKHVSEALKEETHKEVRNTENTNYSDLIEALTKQTIAMNENTLALREQNELLKRQNEELSNALVTTLSVLTAENSELSLANDTKINQIEQIKVMIDGIAKESGTGVRDKMHIANSYLSNAQKEIESKQQKVKE